jgi:hypothetical protein
MGLERRIWRFPISPNSMLDDLYHIEVVMPKNAKVLHVGLDPQAPHGQPSIWAEVDPKEPKVPRLFYSVGTGHGVVPLGCKFIGTVITGPYVFHIYEARRKHEAHK